jgi:indolepyruvate ferredoxin oxidoreductase beta subunit
VYSPIVSPRSVHLVAGFEPVEALRNASKFLAPRGVVVLNTRPIIPTSVSMGKDRYPSIEEIVRTIERLGASKVVAFDATEIAERLGNPIVMNMVMLGALAGTGMLPFDAEVIRETMKERIPGALLEINLKAFDAGFNAVQEKSKQ